MKRVLASFLMFGILIVGVLATSSVEAGATTKKQQLYKELDKKGIDHTGAVHLAKTFCARAEDMSFKEAFMETVFDPENDDLNPHDGGYIVGAGVLVYCPQYKPAMIAFVKSQKV